MSGTHPAPIGANNCVIVNVAPVQSMTADLAGAYRDSGRFDHAETTLRAHYLTSDSLGTIFPR
ncbi:MAG: hypothetical protein JRJ60_10660 [Deltaproteobacteria bacterium]|nr:hypothetical protein [Deltaproteobacteria bacterium]